MRYVLKRYPRSSIYDYPPTDDKWEIVGECASNASNASDARREVINHILGREEDLRTAPYWYIVRPK